MIIYNITFHVEKDLQQDFLDFLHLQYIPFATQSKEMTAPRLARVFGHTEEEGYSYALELKAKDISILEKWHQTHGKELQTMLQQRFEQRVLCFATLLQHIDL